MHEINYFNMVTKCGCLFWWVASVLILFNGLEFLRHGESLNANKYFAWVNVFNQIHPKWTGSAFFSGKKTNNITLFVTTIQRWKKCPRWIFFLFLWIWLIQSGYRFVQWKCSMSVLHLVYFSSFQLSVRLTGKKSSRENDLWTKADILVCFSWEKR